MSTQTTLLLVFLAILIHGIGHLQGVVAALGVKYRKSSSTQSWLLKGLGYKANSSICLVLYLATAIVGISAALSFKGIQLITIDWQNLALITAFLSLTSLILYPKALAMLFNKVGAVAVNGIVIYSILFDGGWPAVVF